MASRLLLQRIQLAGGHGRRHLLSSFSSDDVAAYIIQILEDHPNQTCGRFVTSNIRPMKSEARSLTTNFDEPWHP